MRWKIASQENDVLINIIINYRLVSNMQCLVLQDQNVPPNILYVEVVDDLAVFWITFNPSLHCSRVLVGNLG